MRIIFFTFLVVTALSSLQAQEVSVAMNTTNWTLPEGAVFERFDDRNTLVINRGRAIVKDLQFEDGTIEVDIFATSKRSFAGINYRKQGTHMEEVYMRMHKSGQVDAVQYTPIFHDESNWQLYSEYQANVKFLDQGWNTLRIDIAGRTATVSINGKEVMSVDQLRTGNATGEIGLWALFTSRFANFRYTKKTKMEAAEVKSETTTDPAVIHEWQVTEAIRYDAATFDIADYEKSDYQQVQAEQSGLLPISKYVKKRTSGGFAQNGEDLVIAQKVWEEETTVTRVFTFDYSDKIIVYLNGTAIFQGNNAFRSKGLQYGGHLSPNTNQLFLPLRKGENILQCVVIEKANGWGLIGRLE